MRTHLGFLHQLSAGVALTSFLVMPAFAQTAAAPAALPEIDVISPTPLSGGSSTGLDRDKVPAFLSTVTSQQFEEKKSPAVADAITANVPGAIAISVDGSDLSPDIFFRGFDTSRISGTAQGLAVYQNGVRINEAFGDSTNLDLISPIAIDRLDVYTNNPIFGLNALGGAFNFTMKNGFTYQGGEAQIYGGSYGRVYGSLQYGKKVDDYSFYIATDAERDAGYKPFGAQNLQRAYLDLGWQPPGSEFHAIASFGRSLLGVQGTTPEVLIQQQYNTTFTSPQTTNNQAGLVQLTGRFDISPTWSLASNFYFRQFDQYHVDGNDAQIQDCGDITNPDGTTGIAGNACLPPSGNVSGTPGSDYQFTNHGQPVPFLGYNFPYGTTALTSTHTQTFGTQAQLTNKDKILDHENFFVFGGSVDQSYTHFSSTTTLGQLDPAFQNLLNTGFPGSGVLLQTQGNVGFNSVFVHSTSTYYGVFALDTFNLTKELAVTAGARYNIALIGLSDASGQDPSNNTSNSYDRINPVVGFTYTVNPAFTFYGGYSEANRAPTPSENNCSNPQQPCLLETNLVSDPPLKQVVSHTIEAGARGHIALPETYGALTYKAGYFHTTSTNDILSEASNITGTGYYVTVPETLRQGVQVGLNYANGPLNLYANYAYVDATYQFSGTFSSPYNPYADANGNVQVRPGDHITGVPRNIAKLGLDYAFTPKFKATIEGVIVGSQYYVGDPSNQNPQLPAYYAVNLRASYQATDQIQIFGMINNVTNNHYATYGTFYDIGTTAANVNQTLANNAASANPDYRATTVAQPISFYAGIKVTF